MSDPLEIELGRVVRILRAAPPGPAAPECVGAVEAFLAGVLRDGHAASATPEARSSAAARLLARLGTFDAATLAAVVAAVASDAVSEGADRRVLEEHLVRLRRALPR